MSKYASEVTAIRALRAKYANVPQMTLAKRIKARDFKAAIDIDMAHASGIFVRTMLSIYSVIRRYDAAQSKAIAA